MSVAQRPVKVGHAGANEVMDRFATAVLHFLKAGHDNVTGKLLVAELSRRERVGDAGVERFSARIPHHGPVFREVDLLDNRAAGCRHHVALAFDLAKEGVVVGNVVGDLPGVTLKGRRDDITERAVRRCHFLGS